MLIHRTAFAFSILLAGCATTSETAGRDEMTAQVGIYPPPGPGAQQVRIGIPAFVVAQGVEAKVAPLAADQIATLAANSQRFEVVERAQLDQLLKEQSLEGIVVGGELAKPAQVRGVEWLLLGKVTSLRVKQTHTGSTFNLGSFPIQNTFGGTIGLGGFDKKDTVLKIECGVDLRLVDPTTGKTIVADFSEYDRTDSANALGLQVLGGHVGADAVVALGEDDEGRILRLALDACIRKMLPKVDRELGARAKANATPAASGTDATTKHDQAQETRFCTSCGGKLAAGARFCAGCGSKAE